MAQKRFEDVAIILHGSDTVAVLKRPVKAGDELVNGSTTLQIRQNVGAGHKVAVAEIEDTAAIRRYGQIIGFAKGHISAGEHVHTHNFVMRDFGRDYQFSADARPLQLYAKDQMRYFQGYARPEGRV